MRNVDRMLEFNDKNILSGQGKISNEEMEQKVREIYEQFDQRRKIYQAKEADLIDLTDIECELNNRQNNK